jgi:photosystem II stability/assembly factor-like uncharacterized protein
MKTIITIRFWTCSTLRAFQLDTLAPPAMIVLAVLSVSVGSVVAQDWMLTGAPSNNFWRSIATSADGAKLVATVSDVGLIYSSTNSGTNWHTTGAPQGLWNALASSADGTKLLAVGSDYQYLTNGLDIFTIATTSRVYTSANSGTDWTQGSGTPTNVTWTAAASSADGNQLVVGASSGAIYTSTNAGSNWILRSTPIKQWNSIASSADGTRLVAVAVKGGIFTSVDLGATWRPASVPSDLWWWDVASSADGGSLVAVSKYNAPATAAGSIYVSSNAGTNWVLTSAPINQWISVGSSADATTLVAVAVGVICLSRDSGATWTTTNPPSGNSFWNCVAVSADGSKLFAGISFGGIHVSQTTATPRLNITAAGANAVISWIIPSMEFGLQESSDLSPTNWKDVLAQPTVVNYQKQLVLTPPSGNRFYRLKSY